MAVIRQDIIDNFQKQFEGRNIGMKYSRSMIYLATAYTHKNKQVRKTRAEAVTLVSIYLDKLHLYNYSPITAEIAMRGVISLPGHWEYWRDKDFAHIRASTAVFVLGVQGVEKSVGVKAEIRYAKKLGIPVKYIYISPVKDGFRLSTENRLDKRRLTPAMTILKTMREALDYFDDTQLVIKED